MCVGRLSLVTVINCNSEFFYLEMLIFSKHMNFSLTMEGEERNGIRNKDYLFKSFIEV